MSDAQRGRIDAETDRDTAADLPTLSVVVIARNEENHVERCLESVFAAIEPFDAEVIFVDSNSGDATVERAAEFPVSVFRIPDDDLSTPAAGRYVGAQFAAGEQVLFVDGDIVLADLDWVEIASRMVASDPNLAAVDGHLGDADGVGVAEVAGTEGAGVEEAGTGRAGTEEVGWVNGVALYDAEALAEVGGFDPYLRAREDLHLGFELTDAGYRLERLPTVSGEQLRETPDFHEPFRRWRRGFHDGVADGLFRSLDSPRVLAKHLSTIRYPVATAVWLAVGVASLLALPAFLAWVLASAVGIAAIARSEGIQRAYLMLANWVLVVVAVLLHDWTTPPDPAEYPLERIERVTDGPRLG